jgi:RHS repeat-associated protein
LGDRHQQNGVNYTLDLNTGLTQVLSDGTNTYLYGNGRISQHATQTEYFIGDALGSVRQLTDATSAVTLTQSYAPYGEVTQSVGTSQTSYAYTGESRDANGLTYLRARYYASEDGRFISRDTWSGEYNRPLSLNRWNYVEGNPINAIDPSGKQQIRIWAAAFISPPSINFPHVYVWSSPYHPQHPGGPSNVEWGVDVDMDAEWDGDDRSFYSGIGKPSSRVWHEVIIELDPGKPVEVSNKTRTGETQVVYYNVHEGKMIHASDTAPLQPKATIQRNTQCLTTVEIKANVGNPLSPPGVTPKIDHGYHLEFDNCKNQLRYQGSHDVFP